MLARRPLYQRPNDPTCQLDYFSFYEAAAGNVHVLKEGGLLKLWKKYGLVLKEGFLYFRPAGSGDPSSPEQYKFVIALNDSWKAIYVQLTSLTGKKNCLELAGAAQSYLVCFGSEAERDRWVGAINDACASVGDEHRRRQEVEARLRAMLAAPLPPAHQSSSSSSNEVVNTTEQSATTTKTKKKKKNEARSSGRDHREEEYDDDSTSASEQYSSSQYVYNEMYGLCAEEDSDSRLAESPILGPRRSAPTSHSSSTSAKPKKEKKANGRKGIAGNGPANVSYESLDKAMSGHFTFANRRKQAEQTKAAEAKKKKTADGDDGEAREDDDGYILDVDDDDVVAEDVGTTAGEVSEGYIDVAGAAEGGRPERQQLEERSDEANNQCYAWTQGEEEEEDEQEEEEQSASAQMTKKKSTMKKATMSGDDEAELLTDWNSRFQGLVEQMRTFSNNTARTFKYRVNSQLLAIAQDFMCSVKHYGKIIIAETHLPPEIKTIKPASEVGGVAGGVKYIVQNILFKFAVDYKGIYGSDYAAAKVAGHELKGAACYFNLNLDVCIPFMATLDYRGHRLLAVALAPINDETLVSGTGDGGQTVRNSDSHLDGLLQQAAGRLNLSRHVCGKDAKELYSVADLEGHRGLDGRYYLIDLARVMPPEYPFDRHIKQGHLFRLLRPEFVRSHYKPLCPDACSGFILHDPKRVEHNREVKLATKALYNSIIPSVATLLTEESALSEGGGLEAFLHSYGVNLRMMGCVRAEVRKIFAQAEETLAPSAAELLPEPQPLLHRKGSAGRREKATKEKSEDDDTAAALRAKLVAEAERRRRRAREADVLLLVEMLARVMKEMLLRSLRAKSKALKVPLEEPYRLQVVRNLNRFFGVRTGAGGRWWAHKARRALAAKFGDRALHDSETAPEWSLAEYLRRNPIGGSSDENANFQLLFDKLQKYTGLVLRQGFILVIGSKDNSPNPFQSFDLVELGERVKYMNVIATAEAFLYQAASEQAKGIKRQQFLELAAEKYLVAISANPQSVEALRQMASTCVALVEETKDTDRRVELMKRAKKYYQWSLSIFPKDPQTLYALGQLQRMMGNFQAGAELLLRALELDPNFHYCLRSYAELLYHTEAQLAELVYARARQCLLDRGSGGGTEDGDHD